MMHPWDKRLFYISGYLSKNLDNYVKGVMTKTTSTVFILDGRSGLGKTTLASQIGCYIANRVSEYTKEPPKFSLDCYAWHPTPFIEKLKKAKRGDIVIMDESMIFSNRSTMSAFNRAVVIMMSMIRSKQIFIIFCINSIFDLDRNLALHRADLLLHLYAEDEKFASRGRYFAVPSSKGRLTTLFLTGKKYYSYSKARPAFRDKFSSFFPFDDAEYERRKQIEIKNYFSNEKKESKDKQTRDLYINYLYGIVKLKQQEIADIGRIHKNTVGTSLQQFKD